jgi:hypothetical protein
VLFSQAAANGLKFCLTHSLRSRHLNIIYRISRAKYAMLDGLMSSTEQLGS